MKLAHQDKCIIKRGDNLNVMGDTRDVVGQGGALKPTGF